MCGRFELKFPEDITRYFHTVNNLIKIKPNVNVAPTQMCPVIISGGEVVLMRWGLIPHWTKDKAIGYKIINARKERMEDKPSFKRPIMYQRCLIPATGFYEWQKTENGKQPYYIHLKKRKMYAFAGLWDTWKDHDDIEMQTFTIITTSPNEIVKPIHNRMPVILQEEDHEAWLNPDIVEPERLLDLLITYPADEMSAEITSKIINKIAPVLDSK